MFTSVSSKFMMTAMAASSLLKLLSPWTSKSSWDGAPGWYQTGRNFRNSHLKLSTMIRTLFSCQSLSPALYSTFSCYWRWCWSFHPLARTYICLCLDFDILKLCLKIRTRIKLPRLSGAPLRSEASLLESAWDWECEELPASSSLLEVCKSQKTL